MIHQSFFAEYEKSLSLSGNNDSDFMKSND